LIELSECFFLSNLSQSWRLWSGMEAGAKKKTLPLDFSKRQRTWILNKIKRKKVINLSSLFVSCLVKEASSSLVETIFLYVPHVFT
jgi:hypothetical protein